MESFYHIDVRGWPRIRVALRGELDSKGEQVVNEFLDQLSSVYDEAQRRERTITILFDTTLLRLPPRMFIQKLANWINKERPRSKKYLEKSAVIVNNSVVRYILKAVFFISPPTAPNRVCGTLHEAVNYLGWR